MAGSDALPESRAARQGTVNQLPGGTNSSPYQARLAVAENQRQAEQAQAQGQSYTPPIAASQRAPDLSALVTKLKRARPDVIFHTGYNPDITLFARQAREQGVKATFMGPEGVGNKDVTAIAGPASEGMLVTLPADFSADPANAGLVKAFADKKRDANGPFQMPAYAAVKIIGDAIAGAKSTDPTKVAAYMHKNAFTTPVGKVEYDAKGDLKSFKFVGYTWHKDATKTAAN